MRANLPEGHNKCAAFYIAEPDMTLFETFSDNLRAKIEASPEWQAREWKAREWQASAKESAKGSGFDDMDSDIPF
jgi:hypothetical protein